MKKFFALIVIIIAVVFTIWVLKDKETTLGEEFPDVIKDGSVSEIQVLRGSDDKEVTIIEESQKEELLAALFDTDVKKNKESNKAGSESYWITIKSGDERVFALRVGNGLNVSPYEFGGNKKNSDNYLLTDGNALEVVEALF